MAERVEQPGGAPVDRRCRAARLRRGDSRRQLLEDVVRGLDQLRALADQPMAAARKRCVDRAGNREHVSPGFGSEPRSDQRTRLQRGLDDQRAACEPGDDAVAAREVVAERRRAERQLADEGAVRGDAMRQVEVAARIDPVEPRADDRDRAGRGFERSFVRRAVDAEREPRDDCVASAAQVCGERPCVVDALRRRVAAADDRDRGPREPFDLALDVQQERRVGGLEQRLRIVGLAERDDSARCIRAFQQPASRALEKPVEPGRRCREQRGCLDADDA